MKQVVPARPAGAATAAPAKRARVRYVAQSGPQPAGQAAVPAEVVEAIRRHVPTATRIGVIWYQPPFVEALVHRIEGEPTLLRAEIVREEQA